MNEMTPYESRILGVLEEAHERRERIRGKRRRAIWKVIFWFVVGTIILYSWIVDVITVSGVSAEASGLFFFMMVACIRHDPRRGEAEYFDGKINEEDMKYLLEKRGTFGRLISLLGPEAENEWDAQAKNVLRNPDKKPINKAAIWCGVMSVVSIALALCYGQ